MSGFVPVACVEVSTASRLHFGLFSFGNAAGRQGLGQQEAVRQGAARQEAVRQGAVRQFGGMGAMIEEPALRLRISAAGTLSACGPLAERALSVARRVLEAVPEGWKLGGPEGWDSSGGCAIEIVAAPREHVGLGVGTQLALATVAGMRRYLGLPTLGAEALAVAAGRGLRSAVGTYGFFQGGWIVESGKLPEETLSPHLQRVEIPAGWRFVLITPKRLQGLHGPDERRAFANLPPVPRETTELLTRIALEQVVPAVAAGDFDAVGESLYRFNHESGLCFAASQHGAYADEATAMVVEKLRAWGVAGVGQSSWGPTVFALRPDEAAAFDLIRQLRKDLPCEEYEVVTTAPANCGARIDVA